MSKTAREIITEAYEAEERTIRIFDAVREVIAKMDGQQITKRIATAVQKAHPDWTVHYSTDYGMYHLYIWGGNTGRPSHGERLGLLIGYQSGDGQISLSHFDEYNTHAGSGARSRNELRQQQLDSRFPEEFDTAAAFLRQQMAQVKAMIDYPCPDRYDLEKLAGLNKDR